MQTKNIIIITLLVILGTIGFFVVGKNRVPDLCKLGGVVDTNCVKMSRESKWAHAANGFPKGWSRWEETIEDFTISATGPISHGSSRIIIATGTNLSGLVDILKEQNNLVNCVGDLEIITCAIGENPEILRYWNVTNYFH